METRTLDIPDLVVVEPDINRDGRGWFCEQYNERRYADAGITCSFVQDNLSLSSRGVVRGLHWQAAQHCQAKLVHVLQGAVWDVAVDVREGSPTFGKYAAVYLYAEGSKAVRESDVPERPYSQFFIPRGFAHGFVALEDNTLFSYKCDNLYNKEAERGLLFTDPALGIEFPGVGVDFTLSDKDMRHPVLAEVVPYGWGLL